MPSIELHLACIASSGLYRHSLHSHTTRSTPQNVKEIQGFIYLIIYLFIINEANLQRALGPLTCYNSDSKLK